jgi:hypothetical protein
VASQIVLDECKRAIAQRIMFCRRDRRRRNHGSQKDCSYRWQFAQGVVQPQDGEGTDTPPRLRRSRLPEGRRAKSNTTCLQAEYLLPRE